MLRDNVVSRQRVVDGITYSYDITRGKWLSIGTCCIFYGINHRNINTSRWLAVTQGYYSNNVGFKIPNQGTIIKATFQAKTQTTCEFIVRDENVVDIVTLELDNEVDKILDLNTDFVAGVSLRCFLEIENNKIDFPFVMLECASRL